MKTSAWQEIDALRREREELETHLLLMEMNCITTSHAGAFIEMNCHQARAKAGALVAKRRREAEQATEEAGPSLLEAMRDVSSADFQTSSLVHSATTPSAALRVELVAGRSLQFDDSSVLDMLERRLDVRAFELNDAFNKMRLENSTDVQFEIQFLNDQIGAIHLAPNGSGMLVEACSEWTIRLPDRGTWTHMAREARCFVMDKYGSGVGAVPRVCATRAEIRLSPRDFAGNAETQHPNASPDILSEVVIPSFRGLVAARHQFVEKYAV